MAAANFIQFTKKTRSYMPQRQKCNITQPMPEAD
ncbi:hypothetical protein COLO4_13038 [Corchorus olitorius]|uniref:Uncharacterized protein n=1 Tax=Corchorus olitorius TaxID=93759 RepID=A0A1R3JYI6_9ROSI|nr:hypothetical protein COLO4_13038 [Corchorus olitorius]